jgi:septum site-determining protein MinC
VEVIIKLREELITFKGVKEGIFINIAGNDILAIKNELDVKLKSASGFYNGTKILGIRSENLSTENITELKLILRYKYDLIISNEELPTYILESQTTDQVVVNEEVEETENTSFEDRDESMTKFVNGTLRSGQVVKYDGNIVIIGDVNPGALIEAKGNIIVLGTLRGVAHAGKDGNLNSIVACYNLQPTQLRISDRIARSPDDGMVSSRLPEVARIKDGEVVIEPYLPNK